MGFQFLTFVRDALYSVPEGVWLGTLEWGSKIAGWIWEQKDADRKVALQREQMERPVQLAGEELRNVVAMGQRPEAISIEQYERVNNYILIVPDSFS